MAKGDFIVKLQNFFGATVSEMIFVLVLLVGLLLGLIVRQFSGAAPNQEYNEELSAIVYHSLDSLAESQKPQYTGTDIKNNTAEETAQSAANSNSTKKEKTSSAIINLNTASKTELMQIPGVGDKTAINIIEYRRSKPFSKPSDIMNIKGIGEKKYEKMKPFIEVK